MGTLTKKERDGLEDVFLSIHSNNQKFQKLKDLSKLLIHKNFHFSLQKLIKDVNSGFKGANIENLVLFLDKTKKHLRK
jgi:hypothetical protein